MVNLYITHLFRLVTEEYLLLHGRPDPDSGSKKQSYESVKKKKEEIWSWTAGKNQQSQHTIPRLWTNLETQRLWDSETRRLGDSEMWPLTLDFDLLYRHFEASTQSWEGEGSLSTAKGI